MTTSPTLLLLAPMRLEAAALGPASRLRADGADFVVERLGMGLQKSGAAAGRLSTRYPAGGPADAVAVAGLAGALRDDLVPGDVVVASTVMSESGEVVRQFGSAPLLAGELSRLGLNARTGTVVSASHIVTGAGRAALAGLGADIVDMETAAVAGHDWSLPLAVVRVVSDSPSHELVSPAGAAGAWRALKTLRATRPALARWAAAAGPREVVLAAPRSFCAGVERAVQTVERAVERYGAPVYVRRQIVHNASVVAHLQSLGAIFVHELDEVPDGALVVFSAHGVGTSVVEEAERRHMATIDATCPLVAKVHNEGKRFAAAGRRVVLVGNAGHDEVEGTLGTVPGALLVTTTGDVGTLDLRASDPIAVVTQTTLATDEAAEVVAALGKRFSDVARPAASDICYASQNRQEAVKKMAPGCDLVLVVGSRNSSNSNRLVEVAQRCGTEAHLVDSETDLQLPWLAGRRRVGITAGASAPEQSVQRLVQCLRGLGSVSLSQCLTGTEHVNFPLPMEVR